MKIEKNKKKKTNGKSNHQTNHLRNNSRKKRKKSRTDKKINKTYRKKRIIKKKKELKREKRRKLFREIILTIAISSLLISVVTFLTFTVPKVDGYSMTPTTNDKDRLFVNKWGGIKRFKLIYFRDPQNHELMIRRVIGLPGDSLVYKDGQLIVNGEAVEERFLSSLLEDEDEPLTLNFTLEELFEVRHVPQEQYFVLGDNRAYATDSRFFGFVDRKDIIGVVEMRLFPIHSMTHF